MTGHFDRSTSCRRPPPLASSATMSARSSKLLCVFLALGAAAACSKKLRDYGDPEDGGQGGAGGTLEGGAGAPSSGGRANSNAGSHAGGDSGDSAPCPSMGCECDPSKTRCSGAQPEVCEGGRWAPSGAACLAAHLCEEGTCTEFPSCSGLAPRCGAAANESCCESLAVPGGSYLRSPFLEQPDPASVSNFRLDKFEVTVGRFRRFVTAVVGGWRPEEGAGKHTHLHMGKGLVNSEAPDSFEPGWLQDWSDHLPASADVWDATLSCDETYATWTPITGANENRPLNCANWYQLYAFCIWDGGFLPSEAEWMYAATGGDQQRSVPWGGTRDADHAVYDCSYNGSGTCSGVVNIAPVGARPLGNGRWGQADLVGSMREFSLDCGGPYPVPCIDCVVIDFSVAGRPARGGSFEAITGQGHATTYTAGGRAFADPSERYPGVGARCARTP